MATPFETRAIEQAAETAKKPVLLVHGYVERPNADPLLPDDTSIFVAKAAAELVLQGKVSEVYFTLGQIDNSGFPIAQKMAAELYANLDIARQQGRFIPDIPIHILTEATTTIEEIRTVKREARNNLASGVILLGIAPHVRGVGNQKEGRIHREARRMFGKDALRNGSVQVMAAEDVLRDVNRYGDVLLEQRDLGHIALTFKEEQINRIDAIPLLGGLILQVAAKVLDADNRRKGSKDKAFANARFERIRRRLEIEADAREQDLINALKAE